MKRVIPLLLLASILVMGCNGKPKVRAANRLSDKANFSYKLQNGSTLNQADVQPGTNSPYLEVPEGTVTVQVSTSKTNPADVTFTAHKGDSYTAQVDSGPPPVTTIKTD